MTTTLFSSGYWDRIKPKLMQKYSILTDLDLIYKRGELREMMHHLEIKLQMTDKELRDIIDGL
jgi:hypothetical protein